MDKQIFDWVRNWEPQSPNAETDGDSLVITDALPRLACLALVGPPGSGKTTELERLAAKAKAKGDLIRMVNLRYIASADDLHATLREVIDAAGADLDAHAAIFLDGLDEIPARIDHACRWVIGWLKNASAGRPEGPWLTLYITCRVADWPTGFETELAGVVGEPNVAVYQLAQLSVRDVQIAFTSQDSAHWALFSSALDKGGLWPLAKQPVTLRMLVRAFQTGNGTLPESLVTLYRTALLAMIEDWRDKGVAGADTDPPAPEQLLLAGRIAAASVLSNKANIWTGVYSEQVPDSALPVSELVGGTEQFLEHSFPADERALRRVLHTAVFRGAGAQLFTWDHFTFAEYLTALYLLNRNLPDERVLEFLGKQENDVFRITPQLREVAGWLAGMSETFRKTLIASEPDLLLRSDIAGADHEFKEALTAELLSRFDRGDLHDWWQDQRLDYGRLKCPGLSAILRPYIVGANHSETARRAAINIARACKVDQLASDLLDFALTKSANADLRALAVWTYSTVSEEGIERLEPLLDIEPKSDPEDEIKGAALQALWPRHLDTAKLFAVLTQVQKQFRYGSYRHFLHELTIDSLSPEASVAALGWLRQLHPDSVQSLDLRRLAEPVLQAAWANIRNSDVRLAFAELIATSISNNNLGLRSVDIAAFQDQYLAAPSELRHVLIASVALLLESPKRHDLQMGPWQLLTFRDLPWLLEELISQKALLPEELAINSILMLTSGHELYELEFIWPYSQKHAGLRQAWQDMFTVQRDSPLARWLKEDYENKKNPKPDAAPERPDPLRRDGLDRWIQDCKNDISKWWILNLLLLHDGVEYGANELSPSLADSPGWLGASEEQQTAMLEIAAQYLERVLPPEDSNWLGSNTVWRPVSAGYRSLRLLYTHRRSAFAAMSGKAWETWGATSLWFPSNEDAEDKAIRFAIAATFHAKALVTFLDALRNLLALPDASFDLAELVTDIYDDAIASELWEALQRGNLNRFAADKIAGLLFGKSFYPIIAAATQWLVQPDTPNLQARGGNLPQAVFIPGLFFVQSPTAAWPLLWERRTLAPEHARAIWMWVAEHFVMDAPYITVLTPSQLGGLYTWLTDDFPRPAPRESGFIGPLDHIDRIRSLTIAKLTAVGNEEAVATLQGLVERYPEQEFLRVHLKSTQDAARAAAWVWPTLQGILSRLGVMRSRSVAEAVLAQSAIDRQLQPLSAATAPESLAELKFSEMVTLEQVRPNLTFLSVATEWKSSKGGLSTFNRDFCIGLANCGQTVYCLVPQPETADVADAQANRVRLVGAEAHLGFQGTDLLTALASPPLKDVKPHVIIGHDHITGPHALRIRKVFYSGAKVVHILHTTSDIEVLKGRRSHIQAAMRGGDREHGQRLLCECADLVLAVGPKIYEYACGANAGSDTVKKIVEFIPGFDEEYLTVNIAAESRRQKHILWVGRGDEPELKGLNLALEIIRVLDARPLVGTARAALCVRGLDLRDTASDAVMRCEEYKQKWVKPNAIIMRPYSEDRYVIKRDMMSATCMIMPSLVEPFGLVAQEAIALATPVFVTSESGIAQMLLGMGARSSGRMAEPTGMVLEVSADVTDTAAKWATAIAACLDGERDAFDRATHMREDLRPYMSWNRSLSAFIDRIAPLARGE